MKKAIEAISPQEGFQDRFVTSSVDVVFGGGAAGVGKCLTVNSLALSPSGFVRMGDLKVGDILTDVHGQNQIVQGVFPQGVKEIWEVITENGSKAECSIEHLWEVCFKEKSGEENWRVVETSSIITNLLYNPSVEIFLPTYLNYREKKQKILSVKRTYRKEECVCIKVSSKEELYITNDYIVTHNTSAAVLALAYYVDNPRYRALYVRKNLGELKGGGSMMEEFTKLYPSPIIARTTMSDNPEVEFVGGCKVVMTHMANENINDITERVKGWQYDFIYFDELTAYQWSTFTYLFSRNRGSSGEKPIIRATTNPKRNSWVRKFIDWYVDENGFIDPERDGVIRYFYYAGGAVEDVIWGDTKEEVYQKCKERIDRQIKASRTYDRSPLDFIKSFTFYSGKIGDNQILLKAQPEYLGSLAMAGGAQAEQLLEGNWNVDAEEDSDSIISPELAYSIFENDSQATEKKYITADIAMGGGDNFVALVWQGFHIVDFVVLSDKISSPEIINAIKALQERYDIGNFNVIYDSVGLGRFISGFISGAVAYNSNNSATKLGKAKYDRIKTECAFKLAEMIEARSISIDPKLANRVYKHKNIKELRTFKQEFIIESKVLKTKMQDNGKVALISKKEMGALLGKGRSPDIIDPMIMRMVVDLDFIPVSQGLSGNELMFGKDDQHIDIQDFFNNW